MEVLSPQSVIDAKRPGFEVGEHPVDPRQDVVSRHVAYHMRLMRDFASTGITGPAVGFSGAAGDDIGGHEVMQTGSGKIPDDSKTYPTRSGFRALSQDFHRPGNQQLAVMAAALSADWRISLGTVGNHRFIDFDQAVER